MPTNGREVVDAIATNVRRYRRALGLSMRELADTAGLSAALVSQLERGLANPTLDVLGKLASSLGVRFSDLTRMGANRPDVIKAGTGPQWIDHTDGSVITELFTAADRSRFDVRHAELPAGCVTSPTSHGLGTIEYAFVVSGSVSVVAGEWTNELATGDAIRFDGAGSHTYAARSGPAELITIVAFGETWTPEQSESPEATG